MMWGEQSRIVGVPEHETKLDTAAPAFGGLVVVEAMFEIYGALVDIVTEWEKQDTPGRKVGLA